MPLLHMAVAADMLRDASNLDGEGVVGGGEACRKLAHRLLILLYQCPLGLSLLRPPEGIERGAAQEPELRQKTERRHHRGAELALYEMPGLGIALRHDRRGEMEFELVVALELGFQLALEAAVRIEPRDLIFILIGHQLEGVAHDRIGERRRTR